MFEKTYYNFIPQGLETVPVQVGTRELIEEVSLLMDPAVVLIAKQGQLPELAVNGEVL